MFNRPIDRDALVSHPWDKMFAQFVVKSLFVVSEQFAGIAEDQEVGVFITVANILLHLLVFFLCGSATKHPSAVNDRVIDGKPTLVNVYFQEVIND